MKIKIQHINICGMKQKLKEKIIALNAYVKKTIKELN